MVVGSGNILCEISRWSNLDQCVSKNDELAEWVKQVRSHVSIFGDFLAKLLCEQFVKMVKDEIGRNGIPRLAVEMSKCGVEFNQSI